MSHIWRCYIKLTDSEIWNSRKKKLVPLLSIISFSSIASRNISFRAWIVATRIFIINFIRANTVCVNCKFNHTTKVSKDKLSTQNKKYSVDMANLYPSLEDMKVDHMMQVILFLIISYSPRWTYFYFLYEIHDTLSHL